MNINPVSFQGKIKANYIDLNNCKRQTIVDTSLKNDRILLDFMNSVGIFDGHYDLNQKESYILRLLVNSSHPDINIPYSKPELANQTASLFGQYKNDGKGNMVPDIFFCFNSKYNEQSIEFQPDKDICEEFEKETGKKLYFEC